MTYEAVTQETIARAHHMVWLARGNELERADNIECMIREGCHDPINAAILITTFCSMLKPSEFAPMIDALDARRANAGKFDDPEAKDRLRRFGRPPVKKIDCRNPMLP